MEIHITEENALRVKIYYTLIYHDISKKYKIELMVDEEEWQILRQEIYEDATKVLLRYMVPDKYDKILFRKMLVESWKKEENEKVNENAKVNFLEEEHDYLVRQIENLEKLLLEEKCAAGKYIRKYNELFHEMQVFSKAGAENVQKQ